MNDKIPKSLAIIQDIAGIGRCSLGVALPVVSACGVQACPLPTAVFSSHTGFPTFYKRDLSEDLSRHLLSWERLNRHFDGIYCGYLGSASQMEVIASYIKRETALFGQTRIIIDPVMGDHGKMYQNLPTDYKDAMKGFVANAGLITPNITEACLLTDTPCQEYGWSADALFTISKKLHALGPEQVIVTGIQEGNQFLNYISDDTGAELVSECCVTPVSGASRPGTGDIFASIVCALLLRGRVLSDCVKIAANFVATCIKSSDDADVPVCEGVIFESSLGLLTEDSILSDPSCPLKYQSSQRS